MDVEIVFNARCLPGMGKCRAADFSSAEYVYPRGRLRKPLSHGSMTRYGGSGSLRYKV